MKRLALAVVLLSVMVSGCASGPAKTEFEAAQQLVQRVATQHEGLVRLTLHAVPTGGEKMQVVASTSDEKRGQWSDEEDLKVAETGEAVEMMEGDNLDLSQPVTGDDGKVIAVVGATVSGTSKDRMRMAAEEIAAQVAEGVRAAATPMW